MARVKPDNATYTVRPSDFDSMPPELRAALEVFFTEQQKRDALEEEEAGRAYQSEQADVVLAQPDGAKSNLIGLMRPLTSEIVILI